MYIYILSSIYEAYKSLKEVLPQRKEYIENCLEGIKKEIARLENF